MIKTTICLVALLGIGHAELAAQNLTQPVYREATTQPVAQVAQTPAAVQSSTVQQQVAQQPAVQQQVLPNVPPSRVIQAGGVQAAVANAQSFNVDPLAGSTINDAVVPASAQGAATPFDLEQRPGEHPLMPMIRILKECQQRIDAIADYSATFTKAERVNGKMNETQQMKMRVRHAPFSVYLNFVKPNPGQEVLYVANQNDGNMVALASGWKRRIGKMNLDPNGSMAMSGQLYPITRAGLQNLTRKLTTVAEADSKYAECTVTYNAAVKIAGRPVTMIESTHPVQPAEKLLTFLDELNLDKRHRMIGDKILKQIQGRLGYLTRVGCGYLSLERPTRTLSGGEAQRIRLASQVGSALVGILYVLDEPSIGLHPRDHARLLEILKEIRDRGNTIIMVEHDEDTMKGADHLIDLGPRAGRLGGQLIAEGTPKQVAAHKDSLTGQYLSKKKTIPLPAKRREGHGTSIHLTGASGNNLKNVDLEIPLGTLCGVTGVSGSGKSTLVIDTLYRTLAQEFYKASWQPADFEEVSGLENIDKVIEINQKPIGRTPRSVPATYVQVFPMIRELYASLPESKMRGFKPGHFSFNVKGGRCESCQGGGSIKVEMHFLSDVFVQCETCMGRRYSREILNIKFKDKNIADVLEMTVEEAADFFQNHPRIHRKLKTLNQVGLDYIHLGQSSTTLSGGEAQRVKLSRELSKRGTGKTLYILDEPTTGLHFEDVAKLIQLLNELVDQGNTVLVIEHHLDVIKSCDHLIELGPEGGEAGGEIVFQGTPEAMGKGKTETASFIKELLS